MLPRAVKRSLLPPWGRTHSQSRGCSGRFSPTAIGGNSEPCPDSTSNSITKSALRLYDERLVSRTVTFDLQEVKTTW